MKRPSTQIREHKFEHTSKHELLHIHTNDIVSLIYTGPAVVRLHCVHKKKKKNSTLFKQSECLHRLDLTTVKKRKLYVGVLFLIRQCIKAGETGNRSLLSK